MFRQAFQYFERAEVLAPEGVTAPAHLSEIFLRFNDATNALAAAQHLVEIAPANPRGHVLEGLAYVQMKKFYEAIPPLNDAIALQTNNAEAHMTRAVAYLRLNKTLAAQDDYEQVVRDAPRAYPAYFGLATIAFTQKDPVAFSNYVALYVSNAPPGLPETAQLEGWRVELEKVSNAK
jgi:Flp pilus assembly protein TadD